MGFIDSTRHAVQLLIALGGGLILFVIVFAGYTRELFIGIVAMVPFQPIDSKYESINTPDSNIPDKVKISCFPCLTSGKEPLTDCQSDRLTVR